MKADLHVHSTMSDGTDTPREIVYKAAQRDLDVIALSDHDSIKGIAEAEQAASEAGIEVVKAVELSAYSTTEVHILGYGFNLDNDELNQKLEEFSQQRKARAKAILDRLAQFGLLLDWEKLEKIPGIGRMHIAALLVEKGYCSGISEAFERYLGSRGSAYFPSKRIIPKDAVGLIKRAGGLSVIAHPLRFLQQNRLNDLILGLKPFGLEGLETYYPTHDETTVKRLQRIAGANALMMTGGTDYHGANRNVELGCVVWEPDRVCVRRLDLKERTSR